MTEGQSCNKCEKSGTSAKLVLCGKTKKVTCKDCCIRSSGGLAACHEWKFCWPTFWV